MQGQLSGPRATLVVWPRGSAHVGGLTETWLKNSANRQSSHGVATLNGRISLDMSATLISISISCRRKQSASETSLTITDTNTLIQSRWLQLL